MAVTKTIRIYGQEVMFRASAAIPRLYRVKFHRDIYRDLDALQKAMDGSDEGASTLDTFSLELFENISYIMARHAIALAVAAIGPVLIVVGKVITATFDPEKECPPCFHGGHC